MSTTGTKERTVLQKGYREIATASSPQEAVKYYGEFQNMLDELRPEADCVVSSAQQSKKILEIIKSVREGWVNPIRAKYFAGSGIITVGDHNGEILAASYRSKDDIVAEKYPNYQKIALKKLGLGALLAHIGVAFAPDIDSYNKLQCLLEENKLSSKEAPHHLGYSMMRTQAGFLVAGASGMLPSEEMTSHIREQHGDVIDEGYKNGWVDWEHDEAAGLHDAVAARSVLFKVINPNMFIGRVYSDDIIKMSPQDFRSVNIH